MVGRGCLGLSSDEVLLCCLHVNIGLGQPELGGHRTFVSRAQQFLYVAGLSGSVHLAHVGEQLASVGGGTSRIG